MSGLRFTGENARKVASFQAQSLLPAPGFPVVELGVSVIHLLQTLSWYGYIAKASPHCHKSLATLLQKPRYIVTEKSLFPWVLSWGPPFHVRGQISNDMCPL